MGPGSLMKAINVLGHYRILSHKNALGKLFFFFFARLNFSPAVLSVLIPWGIPTAASSSPPVALAFCKGNQPEDISLGCQKCSSRTRYHKDDTETLVWLPRFTFLVQVKERVFVPSTLSYLPYLTFVIIWYKRFFLSDSHKHWLHIKIDLYFITDNKQALNVYLISSQISTGASYKNRLWLWKLHRKKWKM